jgi:hypothetical protein
VKKEISEKHEYPLETVKLVFDGKVLGEDETLQSLTLTEKSFIVVYGNKVNQNNLTKVQIQKKNKTKKGGNKRRRIKRRNKRNKGRKRKS